MSEQTPEEVAKQEIKTAIEKLEKANREKLVQNLLEEYAAPSKPPDQDSQSKSADQDSQLPMGVYKRFPLTILTVLVLAAGFTSHLGHERIFSTNEIDTKALLASLAFVVSLAAYLAGVVREIVKALASESSSDDKHILKLNAAWVSTAEMQLVLLGALIIARVAFGPVWYEQAVTSFSFDNFLSVYLGLILLFLSGLHARVWWYKCPFKFKQNSKQPTWFTVCKKSSEQ